MKKENLLTVSEYAAAVGISPQAVYKKLNNKLKPFLIVVDGKKYIDGAALEDGDNQRFKEVKQPFNQQFNNQNQPLLERQIEEKDKTIQSLLRQVESLQEQNGKLTELLSQSQQLINQSQYLQAADKKLLVDGDNQQNEKKGFFGIFKRK